MDLSEDTRFNIPLRSILSLVAAAVVATAAYLQLDSRLNSIEVNLMMIGVDISKNSEFRENWPTGEWGSGMLPSDSEQFLRIEAHDRDIEKLYRLQEELIDVRIQLGQLHSEIEQIKKEN